MAVQVNFDVKRAMNQQKYWVWYCAIGWFQIVKLISMLSSKSRGVSRVSRAPWVTRVGVVDVSSYTVVESQISLDAIFLLALDFGLTVPRCTVLVVLCVCIVVQQLATNQASIYWTTYGVVRWLVSAEWFVLLRIYCTVCNKHRYRISRCRVKKPHTTSCNLQQPKPSKCTTARTRRRIP